MRELVRRIEWLSERITAKGGRVADFGRVGTEMVVERGLEVLGELVGRVEGLAEETFYAVDRWVDAKNYSFAGLRTVVDKKRFTGFSYHSTEIWSYICSYLRR